MSAAGSIKSIIQRRLAQIATVAVAVATFTLSPLAAVTSASAATVDMSGVSMNFDETAVTRTFITGNGKANNDIALYSKVATTSGIAIDAVVQTFLTGTASISDYDTPGSASTIKSYFQLNINNGTGYVASKFSFYEAGTYKGPGTGIPVVLKNISVSSIDLDSTGASDFQYTDMTGFQSYVLTNPTKVTLPTAPAVGVTRFLSTDNTNSNNIPQDLVQVKFASMTSFEARFGNVLAGKVGYYGLNFGPVSWGGASTLEKSSPNNQPPVSSDTVKYALTGTPTLINVADFGNYSDPDSNPFNAVKITSLPTSGLLEFNSGSGWQAVALNQQILVSDIALGKLRFTGTTQTDIGFQVYDALLYSVSSYKITMMAATLPQTINVTNPGPKLAAAATFNLSSSITRTGAGPNSPAITWSSQTPGICTVNATTGAVTLTGLAGQCTIEANQPGGPNTGAATVYAAAAPVVITFPVTNQTSQTITFANPNNQLLSNNYYVPSPGVSASSNLPVTLTSYTPLVCTIDTSVTPSRIAFVTTGYCDVKATQDGNSTYAAAVPVEWIFQITAPMSYEIRFDPNGGAGGPANQAFTSGSSVTLPSSSSNPTRPGYTFGGWSTTANGSANYQPGGSYSPSGNSTLYAVWTGIQYTVTYHNDGADSATNTVPGVTTFTFGSTSATVSRSNTSPGNLAKTSYTFGGWNTAANGSGNYYAADSLYGLAANLDLYPVWILSAQHSVIYDQNGGTGTPPAMQTMLSGGSVNISGIGAPPTLSRTGYKFEGWNTAANGTGRTYIAGDAYAYASGDLHLYAVWTVINYDLNFDKNGGLGTAPSKIQFNVTGYPTLPATTVNRVGYTFMGWNTKADATGTDYLQNDIFNVPATTTLYAMWFAESYTITYEANGANGSSATAPAQQYSSIPSPAVISSSRLTRTGYKFEGWNTSSVGTGTAYVAGDVYRVAADLVLYATWTPLNYSVVYEKNGGTGVAPAIQVFTVESGAYINSLKDPLAADPNTASDTVTRLGYTFAGWNTKADGTGTNKAVGDFYNSAADLTLYAKWTAISYAIVYHNNNADSGANTAPGNQSYTVPAPATISNSNGMTRSGFVFDGWNTAADGSGTAVDVATSYGYVPANGTTVNLYPVWVAIGHHSISYDPNGGTGTAPQSQDVIDGNSAVISAGTGLTRDGYNFAGWATTAGATSANYQPGATYSSNANLSLYAVWTLKTYRVTYSLNGGSGSTPGAQNFTVVNGATIASANPTKTGYTFDGWWSTDATGANGTTLLAGDVFADPENIQLYAVWTPIEYTLTYDSNGGIGAAPRDETFVFADGVTIANGSDTLSRPGYTFDGWWNTAADGNGTTTYVAGDLYKKAADLILYAVWKPINYDIIYEKNGGVGTVASKQTFTVANGAVISENTLTRPGYVFDGWNTVANPTVQNPGSTFMADDFYQEPSSLVLYATWAPIEYILVYDANGGTGDTPQDQLFTVETGTDVAAPVTGGNALSKPGYLFKGWWNTAANGTGTRTYATGDHYSEPADLVLYAIWVEVGKVALVYDANGAAGNIPSLQIGNSGSAFTFATPDSTFKRSGYTFGGWNENSAGSGTSHSVASSTNLSADLVVYAKWTINGYTLSYNINGGTSGSVPTQQNYNVANPATVASSQVSRTGYQFIGWNTRADGTGDDYTYTDLLDIAGDTTLYAMWEEIDYMVVYDENGGDGSGPADSNFTVEHPTTIGSGSSILLSGFHFDGWNTRTDGSGTDYAVGARYNTASDLVLYAKWATGDPVSSGGGGAAPVVPKPVTPAPGTSGEGISAAPKLDDKLYFFGDSPQLLPKSKTEVVSLAKKIVKTEKRVSVIPTIKVEGFVLETADKSHDMKLALARAKAVEKQLIASGVKAHFTVVAIGIHEAKDASARRVQVVVNYKKTK
jgi:uncharacterized repeat protein (TIGR02543 family)